MVEPLVPLGVGGGLCRGHHGDELGGHQAGVAQFVLPLPRVDVHPVEEDVHLCGIEVLVLQPSQGAAVHGVAKVRPQLVQVHIVRPPPRRG